MSQYSAIKAATNAYIKSNGMREITGAILNSVMIATINALGKYYQFAGVADRDTDPGSPDENVIYITGTTGTYANFGGIVVNAGEMALLKWDGTWTKQVIKIIPESTSQLLNDSGFINNAVGNLLNYYLKSETYTKGQVDDLIAAVHQFEFVVADTLPTASADTMYKIYLIPAGDSEEDNYKDEYVTILEDGVYSWEKIGSTAVDLSDYPTNEQMAQAIDDAIAAYISSINASVDSNVGTPSVDVSYSSGVLTLAFHNLKGVQGDPGEQGPPGVTSVSASVDNNTGIPSVEASVNAGVLTLTFHNLKGLQGDTGSSVAYPFTLVNNTTTDDPLQALAAAMGKYLQDQVTQLEAKVDEFATGKYYGTFTSSSLLPEGTIPGFAYVGTENPFEIYTFDGVSWSDSGATMDGTDIPSLNPFKGLYVSVAVLESVYQNPLVGDYAYVKNSGTPATANIYSESGGEWTDTGIVVGITDMESVFPLYAKLQLLSTLEKVAWVDANAPTYLSDLRTALLGNIELVSIDATFNSGNVIILDSMSLDDLRQYLTVSATFSDGSVELVTGYQLSGLMTAGTNTITVTYLDETDTFSVTVKHNYAGAMSAWYMHPASDGVAEVVNGYARLKCVTSSMQSNYSVWCADRATTLWSALNGKTVKIRIRTNSVDSSIAICGFGIFQSASITSLGSSYVKLKQITKSNWTLADDGFLEFTFVCDVANFTTQGSLTPGTNATVGIYGYARALNDYWEVYDAQIYEV